MFKKIYFMAMAAIVLLSAACSKSRVIDNPVITEPTEDYTISSFVLSGTSVKAIVYRWYGFLSIGYNPVFISLKDTATGAEIRNATVSINPTMSMGTMQHGCPTDQMTYDSDYGAYKAGVSFTMASDSGWTLPVAITLNGNTYNDTIPVSVTDPGSNLQFVKSVTASDGNTYFLVLVYPNPWTFLTVSPSGEIVSLYNDVRPSVIGMNDLVVAIYRKDGAFSYPAVDGLSLSFTPTMPAMGHGSPDNVNPVSAGNGFYKGKVNFTMTGAWQLAFTIVQGSDTLASNVNLNLQF